MFTEGFKTLFLLFMATGISYIFSFITGNTMNIAPIYILFLVLVARNTSRYFWCILGSILGVIGMYFFFSPPNLRPYFLFVSLSASFLGMLTISYITSKMTSHILRHAVIFAEREQQLRHLNEINKRLLIPNSIEKIIELSINYITNFTNSSVVFYTQDPQLELNPTLQCMNVADEKLLTSSHEKFVAHVSYVNQQKVGLGTSDPNNSSSLYLPLISHNKVWGVIGICCRNMVPLEDNITTFLNLMISPIAIAVERQRISDSHQQLEIDTEKEKTRANLLRAVSHDLRTPLTGMIGSSSTYLENKNELSEQEKDMLISNIHEDANWLLHMVENLLSVTRIQNNKTKVNKSFEPLEEVVSEVIFRLKKRYPNEKIRVRVPEEFLMIPLDPTLIEQVLINLLENAIRHSKTKKQIELTVIKDANSIRFNIKDYGIGLEEERLAHIFDGLSSEQNISSDSNRGIGIGLSICKTIIIAHNGDISASNHPDGALFTFTLPLENGEHTNE